jgi:diguanylate cyclase (GGDEF)-like protein
VKKNPTRLKIALIGSRDECMKFALLLADKPRIEILLFSPREKDNVRFLRGKVRVLRSLQELKREKNLNLVINLSQLDVSSVLGKEVNILGEKQARLFYDLLYSSRAQDETDLLEELEKAYEVIRKNQSEIIKSQEEMERSLSELFFLHEYFKALSTSIKLSEVGHLIVDGANGILGAEISWLYLLEKGALTFQAAQGYPEDAFCPVLEVGGSFEGRAIEEGTLQEKLTEKGEIYLKSIQNLALKSAYAIPLRTKGETLGVFSIGFTFNRTLTPREKERFISMAYVSSLALHNAILHREIEKLSITDRLTGLYDHAYFQERLAEEVANAKRYKRKVSLLMLDIDNFKKFNDTFGHPRGDQVLKKIGEVLREVIREGDIAARYGGEEFVVILPETAKAEAVRVAERVRRRIEREKFEGNKEFPLVTQSVSVGVATYPDDALSKGDLIEQADRALYRAKWGGRNKVAVAESISKEAEKDDDEKGEVEESGKREDTSG